MDNEIAYLTILQNGERKRILAGINALLLDALRDAGLSLNAPCSGEGHCGLCRAEVRGKTEPPTPQELAFPGIGERDCDGFVLRLACMTRIKGCCEVRLPDNEAWHKRTAAEVPDTTEADEPLGVAVDIGTTTVGMRAVSLNDGRILAERCELNDQRVCGADVMTRIAYCSGRDGTDTLHRLISSQLMRMMNLMLNGRKPERLVIAGNTVMLHLLAGISPRYLGQAPYRTEEHFGRLFSAGQLGLQQDGWLMPCIGGFTGGDLTAALLALTDPSYGGEPECDGLALLDLGTNGEMGIFRDGSWTVASAAAGPALEGGGISCGSGAVCGAAAELSQSRGQGTHILTSPGSELGLPVECQVIGNGEPKTLTGPALISLTALLLEKGAIEPSGRMSAEYWTLDGRISYTQADVRQLQLAKGAVAAAFQRLREDVCNDREEKDCLQIKLNITGGLGCRIVPHDAESIGLIPRTEKGRMTVDFLPNLALEGAALCMTEESRQRALDIASRAKVLKLTSDRRFDELFVSCMRLGEPEDY